MDPFEGRAPSFRVGSLNLTGFAIPQLKGRGKYQPYTHPIHHFFYFVFNE
jgi:hypothetical protein